MIYHETAPAMLGPAAARADAADGTRALHDAVQTLAAQLAHAVAPDDPLDAFRGLLRPEVLRAYVEDDLACLLAGVPPRTKNAPGGHLRMYASDALVVRARVVQPGHRYTAGIATLTRHTLVGNAGRAAFVLRRWQLPETHLNDMFDPAVRVEPLPDVALEPGDAIALRAGIDAYDVVPGERAVVVVTAAGPQAVPLAWHYDRATRRPARAEPARKEWLLLRELVTFAEMIGDASLVPALAELADHPSHFIRWAAGKTANRIAPERSRATLERLADDRHPQVRAAARRLVAAMEAS